MGTRLYPNTRDASALEQLTHVPSGTYNRLMTIEARHKEELEKATPEERYELGYKQWKEINDDIWLGNLSSFLVYGWGKFRHLPGVTEGYGGSLEDPELVKELFVENGLRYDAATIALCQGVHWC